MLDEVADNAFAEAFEDELSTRHGNYDPEARLLAEEFHRHGPVGFNDLPEGTEVHPTRESLAYAVALLDSGDESLYDRAFDVIDAVIDAQSTDRDAPYYGCWPWYVEVPPGEMVRVDYNWSAFLGRHLVFLLADHAGRLPEDLRRRVRAALERATDLIVRRDMGPDYTNISLMSTYVALKAGEVLDDDDLVAYGREKLREAVGYTRYHDGFTEYNSPTYTRVALEEIGRMLAYFDDESDRALARVLNDHAWRSIALHYHPESGQLAGPHSRTYENLRGGTLASLVGVGTEGRFGIDDPDEMEIDLSWPKLVFDCPRNYYGEFDATTDPTVVREQFFRGHRDYHNHHTSVPFSEFSAPIEARTYLTEEFALGSFSRMDLWNQRRPLMGYWGSPDEPYYLRLRCLSDRHGGYDFSSAALTATQYENHVLGAVGFLTDRGAVGDDGTVDLGSLRVRFEVGGGGDPATTEVLSEGSGYRFHAGGLRVDVDLLHRAFTAGDPDGDVRAETGRGTDSDWIESGTWVDAVLYEGDRTTVDFADLDAGVVAFGLTVAPDDGGIEYDARIEDERVAATMTPLELPGGIAVPSSPCPTAAYFDRTEIDPEFVGRGVDEYGGVE